MKRLTERDEFGNADIRGVSGEALHLHLSFDALNRVTAALNRLADFEDAICNESGEYLVTPAGFQQVYDILVENMERRGRLAALEKAPLSPDACIKDGQRGE